MLNFVIWLVVGGLIGWVASKIMGTDAQQGLLLNVVVGILGSMLGGWLVSPWLGFAANDPETLSVQSLAIALLGAVVLLALVRLVRSLLRL
jgi:uncharacterized membrane protein YeaQ/YmgE (transglycosylase-associated protein family)